MAKSFLYTNNFKTTLAAPITTAGQTVITVTSTANLPTIAAGQQYAITLNDAATQSIFEVCYVTAIAGANLTVVRGQEGTTARTWLTNDKIYGAVTAAELATFLQSAGRQWGKVTGAAATGAIASVTYPNAFPSTPSSIIVTLLSGSQDGLVWHIDKNTPPSALSFGVYIGGGGAASTCDFFWEAIL